MPTRPVIAAVCFLLAVKACHAVPTRDGKREVQYIWKKLEKTNNHWYFLAFLQFSGIAFICCSKKGTVGFNMFLGFVINQV